MNIFRTVMIAGAGLAAWAATAGADETKCNLLSANSALAIDYEQVGTEACATLCKGTDGCVGWVYTPHNFNPKKAPGECRLVPDIKTEEASTSKFCGKL